MSQQWGMKPSRNKPAAVDPLVQSKLEVMRLNLNVPVDLHNRIKVQCAMKGQNMTEVLVAHLDRLFPPMSVTVDTQEAKHSHE